MIFRKDGKNYDLNWDAAIRLGVLKEVHHRVGNLYTNNGVTYILSKVGDTIDGYYFNLINVKSGLCYTSKMIKSESYFMLSENEFKELTSNHSNEFILTHHIT